MPKPFNNHTKSGFTLIELMVTVSIIALLASIGLTVFTGLQRGARDAKRRGDIDAYSAAYETNYTPLANNRYRVLTNADFASGGQPVDPINGVQGGVTYQYHGLLTTGANTYCICARMETGGGNSSDNACTPATNGNFYCRHNNR